MTGAAAFVSSCNCESEDDDFCKSGIDEEEPFSDGEGVAGVSSILARFSGPPLGISSVTTEVVLLLSKSESSLLRFFDEESSSAVGCVVDNCCFQLCSICAAFAAMDLSLDFFSFDVTLPICVVCNWRGIFKFLKIQINYFNKLKATIEVI